MTQNKVYGLTGGSGSGKSTVASMLAEMGANIIDADKISREIVTPPSPVLCELVKAFGADILTDDNTLDRKKLGRMVFSDTEKLLKLNEITHPAITREVINRIKPDTLNIIDAAALFECGEIVKRCEKIIVVCADKPVRINRICERDGISVREAENRINSQTPQEELIKKSDFTIYNNTDMKDLKKAVCGVWSWR